MTSSDHAYLDVSVMWHRWHAVKSRLTSQKIFGEAPCTECTGQGNDFELIPTVKMETRRPVEGYFGNEFPTVCNHCGKMATRNRKKLKKFIFCFFGKTTLTGKFSKFCSKRIHRDTDPDQRVVFKFREI